MKHFLDIGANVGLTFDRFLSQTNEFDGATVWCFEPSPRHVPGLLKHIEPFCNRFKIMICPFGISNGNAWLHIWQKDDTQGDSFSPILNETKNIHVDYTIIAPTMSINDFLFQFIQPDDSVTIKIDAEGSEYAILDNLKASVRLYQVERIMVEWHRCPEMITYSQRMAEADFRALGHPLERWMF